MKIVPLLYHPYLTEAEIAFHECSDRIWVPKHFFEHWMLQDEVGAVVIAKLEEIPVCVYGPHSESRNTIYAPLWVCEELGVSTDPPYGDDAEADDYIVPIRCRPHQCTALTVQPHTSEHLVAAGTDGAPEEVLSRGFENYTCLREGQTLTLMLETGECVVVSIMNAETASAADPDPGEAGPTPLRRGEAVCIRGRDVGDLEIVLDLLRPLDAPEPEFKCPALPALPATPQDHPRSPTPPPPVAAHPQPSRQERAALAAAAALRRLQAEAPA